MKHVRRGSPEKAPGVSDNFNLSKNIQDFNVFHLSGFRIKVLLIVAI